MIAPTSPADPDDESPDEPLPVKPFLSALESFNQLAEDMPGILRQSRDLRKASATLSDTEARYLVDQYYTLQKYRQRATNQVGAITRADNPEPHETLAFFGKHFGTIENAIEHHLDVYAKASPTGMWSRGITGVGPILAAGLLAHIDITKAPTAGHIWRFAGLDPTVKWLGSEGAAKLVQEVVGTSKKVTYEHVVAIGLRLNRQPENLIGIIRTQQKVPLHEAAPLTKTTLTKAVALRPWNAALKVLYWKLGESFVKVSNNPNDIYGKVYAERKALEIKRNESGAFAEQAAAALNAKRYGADTTAKKSYLAGALPPAHIHQRAQRYSVKLFLAHWQEVAYWNHYGERAPKPYVLTHMEHAHYIEPPNAPWA
jgi:hypothetical protein